MPQPMAPRDFTAPDARLERNAGVRLAGASDILGRAAKRLESVGSAPLAPDEIRALRKEIVRARLAINEAVDDAGFLVARAYLAALRDPPNPPAPRSRWRRLVDAWNESA